MPRVLLLLDSDSELHLEPFQNFSGLPSCTLQCPAVPCSALQVMENGSILRGPRGAVLVKCATEPSGMAQPTWNQRPRASSWPWLPIQQKSGSVLSFASHFIIFQHTFIIFLQLISKHILSPSWLHGSSLKKIKRHLAWSPELFFWWPHSMAFPGRRGPRG